LRHSSNLKRQLDIGSDDIDFSLKVSLFFLKLQIMGYIFNFNDAKAYEQWYKNQRNRFEIDLENRLMIDMLKPVRGDSVLDIGCGIGESLRQFVEVGLQVTGLDPSPYMLDISLKNLGNRVDLYRGFAEDLPFDDNSFNHTSFSTTLEFVEDPRKAIEEACRVAKDRIFIGVLNRYAIKGIQRRLTGMFTESIYNHAKFFGIWELKNIIRSVLGQVPVSWRTVCQLPVGSQTLTQSMEQSKIVQRCPFGAYVGMVVILVPRFGTRPLAIRYQANHTSGAITG
jgi:SAM-dependent methyltransferase